VLAIPSMNGSAPDDHASLKWQGPKDGTTFIDRSFASVPALAGIADLLDAILVT
jgi:hypothetical protein